MNKILLMLFLLAAFAQPAFAKVNVVATLPWIGSIVSEIGKDRVEVTTLVKPGQDPHALEPRPSMILASRKADIIAYNGLDLEIGYLPVIIESSRNPKIQPGRIGNLDCSKYVQVMERNMSVDRSMGDVHPLGNPHYHFSPKNILRIAEGIAGTLSQVDPANAQIYSANLVAFRQKLGAKLSEWNTKQVKGKEFVAYHKLFEYLADEFGFEIVGYVEPKPGIPPTPGHIKNLIETMKTARPDAILTTVYYPRRDVEFLSERTGVRYITIPHDVGVVPGASDWFLLMDHVLTLLE